MKELIEFTNDPIIVEELFNKKKVKTFWDQTWARLEINLPDPFQNITKIYGWIEKNATKRWGAYEYRRPGRKEYNMVIFFEDMNDALFFKLRGGHRAWEIKE
jgi:hypothetical protein